LARGILALLGGDEELLEGLVIIGLASSLVQAEDFAAALLRDKGHDFSSTITRLAAVQQATAFLLLSRVNGSVVCYV
jgi:hypothetical protein